MVKPEDTFEMSALVGTDEVELKPPGAESGEVPSDRVARKAYGYFLNEQSGSANTLTLRIYHGEDVEREISIALEANQTLSERDINSPWLTIPSGRTIKAVATGASVMVVLQCFDI